MEEEVGLSLTLETINPWILKGLWHLQELSAPRTLLGVGAGRIILMNFICDILRAGRPFLPHSSDLLREAFLVREDLWNLSPTPCAGVCFPFVLRPTGRLNGLWLLLGVWTGPDGSDC